MSSTYQRKNNKKKNYDLIQVTNLDELDDEFVGGTVTVVSSIRPGSKDTSSSGSSVASSTDGSAPAKQLDSKYATSRNFTNNSQVLRQTGSKENSVQNENVSSYRGSSERVEAPKTPSQKTPPTRSSNMLPPYKPLLNPVSSVHIKRRPNKNVPGRGHASEDLVIETLDDDFD